MKIILHIGMGKSGSTYIKNNVFKKFKNSIFLEQLSEEMIDLMTLNNIQFEEKNVFKNILTEQNQKDKEYLFISNSSATLPKKFDQFIICDRLHSKLKGCMVILILRNQKSYIRSFYLERLAAGIYVNYKNFFQYCIKNYNVSILPFLNYYDLVKYYSEKFGKNNLKLFLFEELFDHSKNFNKNLFEEKTGINLGNIVFKQEKVNSSIPDQLVGLRCLINRLIRYDDGEGLYSIPTRLINQHKNFSLKYYYKVLLNRFFKSPILLNIFRRKGNFNNNEINQHIEKLYGKSNFKLQKEFNLDLKSNGYPFLDT
tara:strand:+ start:30212 stop:31147 length:936 start_codon:yes stop_codon:yes gene_type:complete